LRLNYYGDGRFTDGQSPSFFSADGSGGTILQTAQR